MQPNIALCVGAGVLTRGDVARLLERLRSDAKVAALASEFGVSLAEMAEYSLDAGLAFLYVCLSASVDEAPGMLLSPGPVADAGWDSMADVPEGTEEWTFYVRRCQRFSEMLGVPPVVIRHHAFTETEGIAARELGAVRNVVRMMDSLSVHYVPAHWRLDAVVSCSPVPIPGLCKAWRQPIAA